ncbi:endonuclease domain-containing protein [Streptomyces sp. ZYX-F-203]
MTERAKPGRAHGLISSEAADALWAALTSRAALPTSSGALTRPPADPRSGYVLLGGCLVPTTEIDDGRWGVAESEVRRAAAELSALRVDRRDLVRVGPFRGTSAPDRDTGTPPSWRRRVATELRRTPPPGPARGRASDGPSSHLAGVEWRRVLVERGCDGARPTWWLPRALVRLLDAAEHAETRWPRTARVRGAAAGERPARPAPGGPTPRRAEDGDGAGAAGPARPATPTPRPYTRQWEDRRYSVLSREPGIALKIAGWLCGVCGETPATVLDHCHEHGYVRAPVCQSCNTRERPDHLYATDVRVAGRYTRLFGSDAEVWLRHWHRCTGCRARTVLPLPHLAAWTAFVDCRPLRPTHRAPRGREPCGALRVSWTGSHYTPGSCLLTVVVDRCPSGEHRVLARVRYRDAVERFGAWLAQTAPAVAEAAGPERTDDLPARPRPVVPDTDGDGLALF